MLTACAVVDDALKPHDSGWLAESEDALAIVNCLRERFARIAIVTHLDVPSRSVVSASDTAATLRWRRYRWLRAETKGAFF